MTSTSEIQNIIGETGETHSLDDLGFACIYVRPTDWQNGVTEPKLAKVTTRLHAAGVAYFVKGNGVYIPQPADVDAYRAEFYA